MVGTNTLIATPQARPPWSAGADARLFDWHPGSPLDPDPARTKPAPAPIARVDSAGSLGEALRSGVDAVWVGGAWVGGAWSGGAWVGGGWSGRALDPVAAIDALCREDPSGAANPGAQLVIEVGAAHSNHSAGGGPAGLEAEMVGLAELAVAHGLAPSRLAMAIAPTPQGGVAEVLEAWRGDERLRPHPLVVTIPSATPRPARSGLVAAAAMVHAAVATDDVRGARRVIEVLLAIQQSRGEQR